MKTKLILPITAFATFVLPAFVFAREFSGITDLLAGFRSVLNQIIPFLIAIAVVVFIYSLIQYITSAGNPEKRKEAQSMMIWGIIIIVVMSSILGIVNIIQSSIIDQTDNRLYDGELPNVGGSRR
jgi:uncharacterized membrane protein YidH (DUF202 family)